MERLQISLKPSGILAKFPGRVSKCKYSPPSDAHYPNPGGKWHVFSVLPDTTASKRAEINLANGKSFNVVGRDTDTVDVVVPPPYNDLASKEHCVFQFREPGKLYIIDLKSTNGTWLNGEEIPSERYIELKHGDRIRLGEWDFLDSDSNERFYEGIEFVIVLD